MDVCVLQHVDHEGPANIASWAKAGGHALRRVRLHAGEPLPPPEDVDALVVLGGPMSVHDEAANPWLVDEKRFLRDVIDRDVPVLGVCLGAQLIADVLGGKVHPGPHREIGWWPVQRVQGEGRCPLDELPDNFQALHWHSETFQLPPGAVLRARSAAYENQAFTWGDRVLALQFHLETDPEALPLLVDNARAELEGGTFVQDPTEVDDLASRLDELSTLSTRLLDAWVAERVTV